MMRARMSRPRWSVPSTCVRPWGSCQPGSRSRWPMSCARGSNGEITGARTAVSTTTATTAIPNSAVRRRIRRRSSTIPSRSFKGRGGARAATDSDATEGEVTGTSSDSDPRIEIRVDDVHQEIDDDEGAREDEYRGLHDGVVAVEDGLHGQAADARPGKDRLGDHRAPEQRAEL